MLLALLAAGLVGHLMLGAAGHHHSAAPPAVAMLATHLAAVVGGALLIAAGERLCRAVSHAVGVVPAAVSAPVTPASIVAMPRADQPMQSAQLLAASVSHRGPPFVRAPLSLFDT